MNSGLFAIVAWPDVALILGIMLIAVVAMKLGIFEKFSMSKTTGVQFSSKAVEDVKVLLLVNQMREEIDNHCRFRCWQAVMDSPPPGIPPGSNLRSVTPLLEMTAFNHILRAIDASGLREYEASKVAAVRLALADVSGINTRQITSWVRSVVGQCVAISKAAAARKIDLYECNAKRRDISQQCVDHLRFLADLNRRYLHSSNPDSKPGVLTEISEPPAALVE